MNQFIAAFPLKLLEAAVLVVTRRRGQEKLHFLNPVPIRLVRDRCVSKYAEPWAAGLGDRLWEAITEPRIRSTYNFGARITSGWTEGSRFKVGAPGAPGSLGEGRNLEVDPPRKLVQSMVALYGGWPMILSGLKTWLETGKLLTTPGSLLYSDR